MEGRHRSRHYAVGLVSVDAWKEAVSLRRDSSIRLDGTEQDMDDLQCGQHGGCTDNVPNGMAHVPKEMALRIL